MMRRYFYNWVFLTLPFKTCVDTRLTGSPCRVGRGSDAGGLNFIYHWIVFISMSISNIDPSCNWACFLAFSHCLLVCLTVSLLLLIANSNGTATASINTAPFEFVLLALKPKRSPERGNVRLCWCVYQMPIVTIDRESSLILMHFLNVRFGLAFSSFPSLWFGRLIYIKHEQKIPLLTLWKNVRPSPYTYSDVLDGNNNASVPRFRIQIRVGRS